MFFGVVLTRSCLPFCVKLINGVDPGIVDGKVLSNGYQIALACGPLKKARYINPAIESELAEFKQEIAEKFAKSDINRTYVFKRSEIYVYTAATQNSLGTTERMTSGELSAK